MREITADLREPIVIGKQGENDAAKIRFPISGWKDKYGEGHFELTNLRPNDSAPYFCVITSDEDYVYWLVKQADVANVGKGKCQLSYVVGETIAKSLIYSTKIYESLDGAGDPPAPYEDWINELLEAAEDVFEAAEIANEYKRRAEAYATGTIDGIPVSSDDPAYQNNAKYYSDHAKLTQEEIDAMYE